MEQTLTDPKIKIKKLYNMLFPYGKFNGDYSYACVAAKREISQLCRDKRIDLLILITLGLDLDVSEHDTTKTLCDYIINNVIDICLTIPYAGANMIVELKYGIVPRENLELNFESNETCDFQRPILVTDNMINFFKEANLGPYDPSDPKSIPLIKFLSISHNGISSRSMLIKLFNMYIKINNLSINGLISSTPLMDKYFHDTYKHLESLPEKFTRQGDPIPKFDPRGFKFTFLSAIINHDTVKNNDLSDEERETLEGFSERIKQENKLVGNTFSYYKNKK